MRHRKERRAESGDVLTICLPELMARLNCGKATAEKIAAAASAKIKIGRVALYHVGKIEAYLDQLAEQQEE